MENSPLQATVVGKYHLKRCIIAPAGTADSLPLGGRRLKRPAPAPAPSLQETKAASRKPGNVWSDSVQASNRYRWMMQDPKRTQNQGLLNMNIYPLGWLLEGNYQIKSQVWERRQKAREHVIATDIFKN